MRQSTDLFTRWTWALMTFVCFSLAVMANRWNFARFVAWWWLDSLPGTTWYRYLAAATSTLYSVRSGTRIARTTVTRCSAFVLTAVERILARFFTMVGCVLRYAVAAFFVAQMSTA